MAAIVQELCESRGGRQQKLVLSLSSSQCEVCSACDKNHGPIVHVGPL